MGFMWYIYVIYLCRSAVFYLIFIINDSVCNKDKSKKKCKQNQILIVCNSCFALCPSSIFVWMSVKICFFFVVSLCLLYRMRIQESCAETCISNDVNHLINEYLFSLEFFFLAVIELSSSIGLDWNMCIIIIQIDETFVSFRLRLFFQ